MKGGLYVQVPLVQISMTTFFKGNKNCGLYRHVVAKAGLTLQVSYLTIITNLCANVTAANVGSSPYLKLLDKLVRGLKSNDILIEGKGQVLGLTVGLDYLVPLGNLLAHALIGHCPLDLLRSKVTSQTV